MLERRDFLTKCGSVLGAGFVAGGMAAAEPGKEESKPEEPVDASVQSLLDDLKNKPGSLVEQGIGRVLRVVHDLHDNGGGVLDYGAAVRIVSKSLSILNEEHRLLRRLVPLE
jgi:hypothetical protein